MKKPAATRQALDVVVIDDNEKLLQSLVILIQELGHNAHGASSGIRGFELVQSMRPGLIICDINLEGYMNGHGVAQWVRLHSVVPKAYLVALSGNSEQSDREKSLHAGFDLHLAKPIVAEQLRLMFDDTRRHHLRILARPPG